MIAQEELKVVRADVVEYLTCKGGLLLNTSRASTFSDRGLGKYVTMLCNNLGLGADVR